MPYTPKKDNLNNGLGGRKSSLGLSQDDDDDRGVSAGLPRNKISQSVGKGMSNRRNDVMPMYRKSHNSKVMKSIGYNNPRHHHYNHAPL